MVFPDKSEEYAEAIKKKMERYDIGTIKSYVSPKWTLEYCLALSCLGDEFHKAIHYGKKINNSNKYSLTNKKIQEEIQKRKLAEQERKKEENRLKKIKRNKIKKCTIAILSVLHFFKFKL